MNKEDDVLIVPEITNQAGLMMSAEDLAVNITTEGKQQRKFKVINMWQAANHIKPPDWLIKNYLELDTVAGLFAPPANCKSMVAVDLACCVATGKHWHGYRVKQGGVLYIAGEGSAGLKKRVQAWKIRQKRRDEDIPLYLSEHSIDGQNIIEIMELCEDVEAMHDMSQSDINLVIVDTVARNFGAGDENSARDMGMFIQHMDYIRRRWNCAVLLVHHTGHGDRDRARGSSAFRAALDAEYVVRKDQKLVELKATKMKDADEPGAIHFELHSVDLGIVDEDGLPVTSAILDLTDKDMPERDDELDRPKLSQNYQAALSILDGMYREYRENLSKGGKDPAKAMVEYGHWRQRCLDAGLITGKHWTRIPKTLEEKGYILRREPHVFLVDD